MLLSTDGSLSSLAATVHAVELARESGAELHVLHVATPESDMQVEFAETNLELLHVRPVDGTTAACVLASDADVECHTHEVQGPIADAILQAAQRIDADAIVMGQTGIRPFPQIGLGSVSEAVESRSSIPVILVSGRAAEVVPVVKDILARDPDATETARASAEPDVDWAEAAQYPAFSDLMSTKVRFLVPLLVLSLGFYLATTLLAGLAPGFTGQLVIGPLSVGYLLVFLTYILAWVVAVAYVRVANRSFDAKAAHAVSEFEERQGQREGKA
ncbi:MAG: universal stress protein [Actinomycetota bacterium]|nr:universal stress protein [Actinomycetota bacterium]